jgi:hypothetical protein
MHSHQQQQEYLSQSASDMIFSFPPVAMHASFQQSAPIQPLAADLKVRKSISDSCMQRGLQASYNSKNVSYMLMSRSGGSTVKEMIRTINERCEQAEAGAAVLPPKDEISILAHFAPDAFYRVVISGKQGLSAITRAMRAFSACRDLQECACLALGNLCTLGNNLVVAEQAGAVPAIITAMRQHSSSVAVQSAACDALRNMSGLILAYASTSQTAPIANELKEVLSHTSSMYLLPAHRQIADALSNLLRQASCQI